MTIRFAFKTSVALVRAAAGAGGAHRRRTEADPPHPQRQDGPALTME